jgi:hypothetical protein
MKSYAREPLTPRMLVGLRELRGGGDLDFPTTSVGRPTKQRLAKLGLATFDRLRDWDGPMHVTPEGL